MWKRVFLLSAFALFMGCEMEKKMESEAQRKNTRADPTIVVSGRNDFANGTMEGLELLPEGTLALKRKNLLNNSSFEWDDEERGGIRDGLAYSWGLWGKGYGTYSDRSIPYLPNEPTHGTRSQRIQMAAEGKETLHLIQTVHGLAPDLAYTFSADVKTDEPKQIEIALSMQFYTAEKWHSSKTGDWSAQTKFTRLSLTTILPKECDGMRCMILFQPKVDNGRGTVWVDAAQLEQSDKATAYCAGYCTEPGEFVSPPIDLSMAGDPYKFSWIASQPSATDVQFQIRSADTKDALASAAWHGPKNADAYATRVESGPDLMSNSSLERDSDGDNVPDGARTIGYGENDRKFAVVTDARDGRKALKVEIAKYKDGNGRWEVGHDGPFEKDTEYAFSVWHKEDSAATRISMGAAVEEASGNMHWGYFSESKTASTDWRRDTVFFRTPKDREIKRLYLELNLGGLGWAITDCYSLRRVAGSEEWALNPAHRGAKWLQYKAVLSTSDSAYTPKLYRTEFTCGPAAPEIRWLNVLADDGQSQRYSFCPGQTAIFRPQVVDFTGVKNIDRVELTLMNPSGSTITKAKMSPGEQISDEEACYTWLCRFPEDAPPGEWQAVVEATNRIGLSCREMAVLKIRKPYKTAPKRMTIGALVNDYGFRNYKGDGLEKLIEEYRSCTGLEIWKLAVAWSRLEPMPGEINQEVIEGFKKFIAAAHTAKAKAQITIQQQSFPDWVNDGNWDNINRYRCAQTRRLANTWAHLAKALKDSPGLDSYLLINEENHVRDAEAYLRSMSKVQSAVRVADADLKHRITVRPNTRDPYIRTRIATGGAQDYDYGSGGYPTHSSWFYKEYANPVSQTSCLRMAAFHASPLVFGGPGGIGEVGFFVRKSKDKFGDEERLLGFERAMQIAYEMGMDEFVLWGGTFSFDQLSAYYPKLAAFRNELVKKPHPAGFDVRVVMGAEDKMFVSVPPNSSKLDMTKQPFAPVFRFLDGKGYVWYYTTPEAMAIQDVSPVRATVKLSDLKDKDAAAQEKFLAEKLKGIKPSGAPLPWPENAD